MVATICLGSVEAATRSLHSSGKLSAPQSPMRLEYAVSPSETLFPEETRRTPRHWGNRGYEWRCAAATNNSGRELDSGERIHVANNQGMLSASGVEELEKKAAREKSRSSPGNLSANKHRSWCWLGICGSRKRRPRRSSLLASQERCSNLLELYRGDVLGDHTFFPKVSPRCPAGVHLGSTFVAIVCLAGKRDSSSRRHPSS